MNKKERAKFIQKTLDYYFPNPQPFLYFTNPFTLLIAVLLSAQCTDAKVNKITPLLFKKADTPQKMYLLGEKQIAAIIKPLGLYKRKSHAIFHLCKKLIKDFASEVPSSLQKLQNLPGVGRKTASVVLITAFKKPALPVDTHIHRLAKRWHLSSGKNVLQTEKDLKKLFPRNKWNKLHLQMIAFARKFCPAKGHKKSICPICSQINP